MTIDDEQTTGFHPTPEHATPAGRPNDARVIYVSEVRRPRFPFRDAKPRLFVVTCSGRTPRQRVAKRTSSILLRGQKSIVLFTFTLCPPLSLSHSTSSPFLFHRSNLITNPHFGFGLFFRTRPTIACKSLRYCRSANLPLKLFHRDF